MFLAVFSTFTSLLSWQNSCVTSKSSNYTIVLINVTNGKPTTRLLFSIDAGEAIRRHPLWHAVAACLWAVFTFRGPHSQLAAFSLVRELQKKPWRPRSLCTDCWMEVTRYF